MDQLQVGTEVDFTKGEKANDQKFSVLGRCRIVSVQYQRVWVHIELQPLAGKYAGKILKYKVRELDTLLRNAPVVAKSTEKAVKEVRAAQHAHFDKKCALQSHTYDLNIEPGDIVKVTDTRDRYRAPIMFRVFEVDAEKNRIKGWAVNRAAYTVGSRMAWFTTTQDMFKFEVVQKKAFVVQDDPLYIQYKTRNAKAGAKRAATRADREELRNRFGF